MELACAAIANRVSIGTRRKYWMEVQVLGEIQISIHGLNANEQRRRMMFQLARHMGQHQCGDEAMDPRALSSPRADDSRRKIAWAATDGLRNLLTGAYEDSVALHVQGKERFGIAGNPFDLRTNRFQQGGIDAGRTKGVAHTMLLSSTIGWSRRVHCLGSTCGPAQDLDAAWTTPSPSTIPRLGDHQGNIKEEERNRLPLTITVGDGGKGAFLEVHEHAPDAYVHGPCTERGSSLRERGKDVLGHLRT